MKAQDFKNNENMQGKPTADRAFTDHREIQKQRGVSNAGAQPSFTTSSKDGRHQPQKKKNN